MAARSLAEARALVVASAVPLARTERVALAAAHGRVLAEPVRTSGPWPATDRAAMDGFAVRAGAGLPAGTQLPVVGESLAGRPFAGPLPDGAAIRIMTGAVVPAGADTVVAVERTSGFAGDEVRFDEAVQPQQNIRLLGSEQPAGAEVLVPGTRLDAAAIGALAVLGRSTVAVAGRPVVAIVATGDEIVPVESEPLPHQVRDSNSWALAAQVAECGGQALRLGIAPDDPAGLGQLLRCGLEAADVLVTIGGISKGTHDLVHDTLQRLGVLTVFHGIDLKPGKPTYFGSSETPGGRRYALGLPGNPASAFTVFDLLGKPLLHRLLGIAVGSWGLEAPLAAGSWRPNSRLQALPARWVMGADRRPAIALVPGAPSGDPFALLGRALYALVPPAQLPAPGAALPIAGGSSDPWLP